MGAGIKLRHRQEGISMRTAHKHGLIIEVSNDMPLIEIFRYWRPLPDEEVYVLDDNSGLLPFSRDTIWVKLRKACPHPDHAPEDCDTRLPLVLEGHEYQRMWWGEWADKFARGGD